MADLTAPTPHTGRRVYSDKAKGEAFQHLLTPFETAEHLIKLTSEPASRIENSVA
jgi:hypothetical protein